MLKIRVLGCWRPDVEQGFNRFHLVTLLSIKVPTANGDLVRNVLIFGRHPHEFTMSTCI